MLVNVQSIGKATTLALDKTNPRLRQCFVVSGQQKRSNQIFTRPSLSTLAL